MDIMDVARREINEARSIKKTPAIGAWLGGYLKNPSAIAEIIHRVASIAVTGQGGITPPSALRRACATTPGDESRA